MCVIQSIFTMFTIGQWRCYQHHLTASPSPAGGEGGIDCADLRADIAHRTAHTRYLDIYTGLQGTGLPNYFVNTTTRTQEGAGGVHDAS